MPQAELLEFFMPRDIRQRINRILDNTSINEADEETVDLIRGMLEGEYAVPMTIQAFWLDWNKNKAGFYIDVPFPILIFRTSMKGENAPIINGVDLASNEEIHNYSRQRDSTLI